jgi:hypothetical protein
MIRTCCILPVSLSCMCLIEINMASAEEPVTKPDLVFLLIGQSNMAGRAHLEDGDDAPIPGVLMLDDKGEWIAAANPLNRFASNRKVLSMQRIGPGAGFAHRMHAVLPDQTLGLIVNARGGTSINAWKKGGALYDNALKRVRMVPGTKIAGVLWHQGEADRNDPEYLAKLKVLIATLRTDLESQELPFVAGEVFGTGYVNKVFAGLADTVPHTGTAKATDLKVFDGVHFDRKSQLTLGERYAEAMLKLLKIDAK